MKITLTVNLDPISLLKGVASIEEGMAAHPADIADQIVFLGRDILEKKELSEAEMNFLEDHFQDFLTISDISRASYSFGETHYNIDCGKDLIAYNIPCEFSYGEFISKINELLSEEEICEDGIFFEDIDTIPSKDTSRAKRRKNSVKKAIRKRNIIRSKCKGWDMYNNLHQYADNKIHESGPKYGKGWCYDPDANTPAHDRLLQAMSLREKEYLLHVDNLPSEEDILYDKWHKEYKNSLYDEIEKWEYEEIFRSIA